MDIDKEWLAKQEAINEQLRRRAKQHGRTPDATHRGAAVRARAQAGKQIVQRSLAAAGRILPRGG
ncbi:MAG: hypothetical protein RRC07_03840 [Anaerolineae bacterium]|nr:hypothetical protein [Anaerolineae bacterium]